MHARAVPRIGRAPLLFRSTLHCSPVVERRWCEWGLLSLMRVVCESAQVVPLTCVVTATALLLLVAGCSTFCLEALYSDVVHFKYGLEHALGYCHAILHRHHNPGGGESSEVVQAVWRWVGSWQRHKAM